MKVKEKLKALRKLMKKNRIDLFCIPSSDPHQSENVADRWKARAWISDFTGSAGSVMVTKDSACLFTDGRYDIQASKQLKGSGIDLVITNFPNAKLYHEWIKENFSGQKKITIGVDGQVVSASRTKVIENDLKGFKVKFKTEDLIDEIWDDRPGYPSEDIVVYEKYSGTKAADKTAKIREHLKKENCSHYLDSTLDNIAWMLNIRGNDIPYSPVVMSHLLISEKEVLFFVDKNKADKKVQDHLKKAGVTLKDYGEVSSYLSKLKKNSKIMLETGSISAEVYGSVSADAEIIEKNSPVPLWKSVKDKVEIRNIKKALIKEGAVLVKFQIWLEKNAGKGIKELDCSSKLTELRQEQKGFIADSFNTIAACKENAALMHYAPHKRTQSEVKKEGFLLIDTGGNYIEGTTDTTRTYALGNLTSEEKNDYTLVLKGHINLVKTKFLKGTTGHALDVLARQPIWNALYDYKCGTGHGVGAFLNVHEGPQGISPRPSKISLQPGMITTVEPGIYKEGKHGIRIENMYLTKKYRNTPSGEFYENESITFVPIDTKPLVKSLMTKEETSWLNKYHAEVYKKLSKHLTEKEKKWLKKKTEKI